MASFSEIKDKVKVWATDKAQGVKTYLTTPSQYSKEFYQHQSEQGKQIIESDYPQTSEGRQQFLQDREDSHKEFLKEKKGITDYDQYQEEVATGAKTVVATGAAIATAGFGASTGALGKGGQAAFTTATKYSGKAATNLAVGLGVSKGTSEAIIASDKGEFKRTDAVKEATIAGFEAQAQAKQTFIGRTAESMFAFAGSKSTFKEAAKQSLIEEGFSGSALDSALKSAMKRRTAKGTGEFTGLVAQAANTEKVVGPVIKSAVKNKGFWQSTLRSAPILAVAGTIEGAGAGAITSESRQGKINLQDVKQGAMGGAVSAPLLGAPIIGFAMRSNKLQGLAKQSFIDNSFKDATKFASKASTSKKISNTLLGSAYVGDVPEAIGDFIEAGIRKTSRKVKKLPSIVKTPSLSSIFSPTNTQTPTNTPTSTPSPTNTIIPSFTPTPTPTKTPTPSNTIVPSITPTPTPTPSPSPSDTFTPTQTPTQTTTKTTSFTPTMTNTPTPTPQGVGFFPPLNMFGNRPTRKSKAKGKKVIRNVKTVEQLVFG